MRVFLLIISSFVLQLTSSVAVADVEVPPPGELVGIVELISGQRAENCVAVLAGVPIGSHCSDLGIYDLRNIPQGRWDLIITVVIPFTNEQLAQLIPAAANSDTVAFEPTVVMSGPITIGGTVSGISQANASLYFVTVGDASSTATHYSRATLTEAGTFLVHGVAPGRHTLDVRAFGAPSVIVDSRLIDVFASLPPEIYTGLSVAPGRPTVPPGVHHGP